MFGKHLRKREMNKVKYHEIGKDDLYLRTAMWEVYQKKCIYCGIALEPRHMQVDHILPIDDKDMFYGDEDDFKEYIRELESRNFPKDCIENYVLSCSDCNGKKRNYRFSASNLRYFHELAARKSEKIFKKMEARRRDIGNSRKSFGNCKKYIEQKKIDESELICDAQTIRSIDVVYFQYGLGEVRIDAYIPTTYEREMRCVIFLKALCKTGIYISCEEKDIKERLFSGYKTDIKAKKRQWCVYCDNVFGKSICKIVLPNMSLEVSMETLEQMAQITDKLFEEYILQKSIINSVLGTFDFPEISKRKYKLFAIQKDIFRVFYNYMQNHQYDQSYDDTHNIFHLTGSEKLFYLHRNQNVRGMAEIYACISLKINEDYEEYYDVIWSPGYLAADDDKMCNFNNITKWTAEYTYKCLVDDFIPTALKENDSKNVFKFIKKRKKHVVYNEEYLLANLYIKTYKNK